MDFHKDHSRLAGTRKTTRGTAYRKNTMKILNVSCAQQDKIEQRLFDEVEAGGYEDWIELCGCVANEFGVDAKDVEHIYDDLFVYVDPQWVGSDYYDEEYHDILWDDEERCYYVED